MDAMIGGFALGFFVGIFLMGLLDDKLVEASGLTWSDLAKRTKGQ